jgi:hypothetical protein
MRFKLREIAPPSFWQRRDIDSNEIISIHSFRWIEGRGSWFEPNRNQGFKERLSLLNQIETLKEKKKRKDSLFPEQDSAIVLETPLRMERDCGRCSWIHCENLRCI